jgi:myo-inositol 2-dehydrogenase/D-chiro-inositol 1-dehydrogenase
MSDFGRNNWRRPRINEREEAQVQEPSQMAVGVVGSGGMGAMHAENVHTMLANARLAAVADTDVVRAERLAERCGSAAVYRDPVGLIRDDAVEAVVIASPDPTHLPLVLECLEKEKPVLCEKPLAGDAGGALEIVEAEVELGRKLVQVGFMRRYDPQHFAVKEAVASGSIGEPMLFKGWHRNLDQEPGLDSAAVVTNSTIHDLDSARWYLGEEIEEVYALGVNTAPKLGKDVLDLQLIQFSTTGGRLGTIETNAVSGYGYEVGAELVGELGTVQTAPPGAAVVRRDRAVTQRAEEDWLQRFHEAYVIELRSWIESLGNNTPTGPDAWDGYASLVVADACIASLRSGSSQKVPTLKAPTLYANEGSEVVR